MSCSHFSIKASVPVSEAKTPPLSISPTTIMRARASLAMRELTMSAALRLISAGLPAPSRIMRSLPRASEAYASQTSRKSTGLRRSYSRTR